MEELHGRKTQVRSMTDEKRKHCLAAREEELIRPKRMRLVLEDFTKRGFTSKCLVCEAIIGKGITQRQEEFRKKWNPEQRVLMTEENKRGTQ